MDALTGPAALRAAPDSTTAALLLRLWREHLSHHKPRLLFILVLTLLMAGTTAPISARAGVQAFQVLRSDAGLGYDERRSRCDVHSHRSR